MVHWHESHASSLTTGQRIADHVASAMGSWPFIITQSGLLVIWVFLNITAFVERWDPYPFILLNLALSLQAAYAAPLILISQNRQAERDRHQADADYRTNVEAKQEIEAIQLHLAKIEKELLLEILRRLDNKGSE